MKIATILGTRPELIRLSRIIPLLDELCDHTFIHTTQNAAQCLSDAVIEGLGIRTPDYSPRQTGETYGQRVGSLMVGIECLLSDIQPDRVLILGDTNTGLAATLVAKRLGISVAHLEAGNRCYDDNVPEEVNRRIIDTCSDILMPYTERSRQNLLEEFHHNADIFAVGNPIGEVLDGALCRYNFKDPMDKPCRKYGLDRQRYLLVTLHRSENVDDPDRLRELLRALTALEASRNIPVVCTMHPHLISKAAEYGIDLSTLPVRFILPPDFDTFVGLEHDALCVLTDSGTVPEECCIMGVPCVIMRDVTERPELLDCGSTVLGGTETESILRAVKCALGLRSEKRWEVPVEYQRRNVASTVVRLVLGKAGSM